MQNLTKGITREFVSTALLSMAILGSAVMASRLSDDTGIRLIINMVATVFMIFYLISMNSRHFDIDFNPVVTLFKMFTSEISKSNALIRIFFQFAGALAGALIVNFMFNLKIFSVSSLNRDGINIFAGELIATLGLLWVILSAAQNSNLLVPTWIGAAIFFTSSTAFANPAITFGRIFSESFAGVSFSSAMYLILSQTTALLLMISIRKGVKLN